MIRSFLALVPLFATCCASSLAAEPAAPPSLRTQLEELSAGFADKAPPAMREAFAQGIADVRALGLEASAKQVGDRAPDGVLLNAVEVPVEFSSLWADGPVVVSFYRGGWCPYCNLQLRALQASLESIEGAGAKLVAITPEQPQKAQETASKNSLAFQVLSDKDNQLAKALGIAFTLPEAIRPIYRERIGLAAYNGNDDDELPLAATFIIDRTGEIRWVYLESDYKQRAEPADIVAAVEAL
ncbi:peroxiredoxin-like family protein [Botrimarina hoheduenensis]|uniref:thioredoxin-dependent peroxiredoxin n=1 Tax=Botrimarina hoheduenensis TaxID=2528000 RepID=A0A5C5W930_9BACT|nr:peroxiredoxin-like family protein [Botrimarina hoheduenensis]TWT46521.1 putative peroxiredoxin bcp [Botrimarina hoheduenensis]